MYRVLIFLACLAVGFGANNATNSSTVVIPTAALNVSTTPLLTKTVSTIALTPTMSLMSSSMVMSPSAPIPTPTTTPTPKPTVTTTTPKPTTVPTTPPKPTEGDYSVKDKINGSYCLLAKLDVSFNISYYQNKTEKNNKTIIVKAFASFAMPFSNFLINGSECGSESSILNISWPRRNPLYFFTMNFAKTNGKNNASSGWKVTGVSLNVSTENNTEFMNANETSLMLNGNETVLEYLSGGVNGSYRCGIVKDYPFNKDGMMMINHARLQPFDVPSKKGKEEFGEENNCEPKKKSDSSTSNIVPIAVGCALAGLVLIVLIAYIIGRRKSQRGYEKV